jgi:hypothetical protein
VEWLIFLRNLGANNSIGWKSMIKDFPFIGEGLVYQIGNGKEVRIDEDPCVNSGLGYKLYGGLIAKIYARGVYSVWDT